MLRMLNSMIILYSYVLGHDAMKKMSSSNVLIVGLKGLGVEIGRYLKLKLIKKIIWKSLFIYFYFNK